MGYLIQPTEEQNAARRAMKQQEADALGFSIHMNRLREWADACRTFSLILANANNGRPREAAFWAQAHADLMERIVEVDDLYIHPRLQIATYEDVLAQRAGKLQNAVREDEAAMPEGFFSLMSAKGLAATRRGLMKRG